MWVYDGHPIDEFILGGYIGFVYKITRLSDGKGYIGKKLLKASRTKQINGKKKKVSVDSNWKKYWGSNKELQEDVKELGEDAFSREILCFCKGKGECNYMEMKYQIQFEVLESDNFYNDWILVKVHRSHLKKMFMKEQNEAVQQTLA
jgi:hypothetical protein